MTCSTLKVNGTVAIICTKDRPRRKCRACGQGIASKLCDFPEPSARSKTCDAPLCGRCAVNVGEDRDFCPHHPRHVSTLAVQGRLL